jgi:hypothetical protein
LDSPRAREPGASGLSGTVSAALERTGLTIAAVALGGGLVVGLYAFGDGLHGFSDGRLSGVVDALRHLLLYPIVAAFAGGVAAVPGVVVMYAGHRLKERGLATEPESVGTSSQAMPLASGEFVSALEGAALSE